MSKEQLTFYGNTDMGKQRTNNEDAFIIEYLDPETVLAIVIDGVGGYEGGEVAAEIAQREIPSYLKEFKHGERLELLKQAVVSANNTIYERRLLDTVRANMSCVLTVALIDMGRNVVDLVHVGDTRIYQYYQGELIKLSHDHSLIGYREEIGDLTEEEAMRHPQRNVISREVGSERHEVEDPDFLEAQEFPLLPNTIFLLCSDGLTDLITSRQIIMILEQQMSLETKVEKLIEAANEAGGKDNITVVLVKYNAEEEINSIIEEKHKLPKNQEKTFHVKEDKSISNKKNIIKVLIIIMSFLLTGCIALLIFQRFHIRYLETQIEQIIYKDSIQNQKICNIGTSVNDTIANQNLNPVKIIAQYSNAIENNDYQFISQVFATNVIRYFEKNNISNTEVVKIHKQYDKRNGIKRKQVCVRWDTWETKLLPDENILVSFVEDYHIERIDTTKQSKFILLYHMIFDREGKIISCYYDKLR